MPLDTTPNQRERRWTASAPVQPAQEPTVRDVIELLRRGLLPAMVVAVAAAAGAYFLSRSVTPVYEAKATLVSASQDPNRLGFGTTLVTAPMLDANAYSIAVSSYAVLADALEALDGRPTTSAESDGLIRSALTVRTEGTSTSPLLRLQVRHILPERARDIANAIAAAAIRWDEQRATRALENIIDSLQAQITSIDAELADEGAGAAPVDGLLRTRTDLALQLSSARALRSGAVGRLELLESAQVPRTPVSPRPMRNAVLAGFLSVLLVYGLLLLREALDTRVRSLDDLELTTQLPILAGFPRVAGGRRALPQEAAAYLRTAIGFATPDAHPVVLLVTSTGPDHGKSSVAIALAESFARLDYRVLLIDADLRQPVLGREYALVAKGAPSVGEALAEPLSHPPMTIALDGDASLDLLPGFTAVPNPTELLRNRMSRLIYHHAGKYDVIVLDSAPVLPVADTLTIAPHVTGIVLAASLEDTHRRQVVAAIKMLRDTGARVLGLAVTNLPKRYAAGQGYGYGYGYGAGHGTPNRAPVDAGTARPVAAARRA